MNRDNDANNSYNPNMVAFLLRVYKKAILDEHVLSSSLTLPLNFPNSVLNMTYMLI
jgi:hypothetical protein